VNYVMGISDVQAMIEQVEGLLKGEGLSERAEVAIEKLLNVVEALCADKKALADEVERLRKELEQKKKNKTTAKASEENDGDNDQETNSDHSSEQR